MRIPFLGQTSSRNNTLVAPHQLMSIAPNIVPSHGERLLRALDRYKFAVFALTFGTIGVGTVLFSSAASLVSAPTSLAATSIQSTTVAIKWNKSSSSSIKQYQIARNNINIATVSSTQLTYNDTGLKAKTRYEYKVRAVNTSGQYSSYSSKLTVTTLATAPTPPTPTPTPTPTPVPVTLKKCRINLHGKGGKGSATYVSGDVTVINPGGNAAGWGGLQWLYFPDSGYQAIKTTIDTAITTNACGQVAINGFSNGGAAAAKIYCKGETFGGKLVGAFINDSVPDHGVDGCVKPAGVKVFLFRSNLESTIVSIQSNCASQDWTCEGGTMYPLSQYVGILGLTTSQYVYDTKSGHSEYAQTATVLNTWWK